MIIPDKKKAITVIMAKLHPKGGQTEAPVKPEDHGEHDPALMSVAEDLHMALKNDSVQGVYQALQAFKDMIASEDEAEDAEDESHEE